MDNSREEEFEKFARWYALPLDKSEDGIYLALETQSAWVACQNWQAKVEELQKQVTDLDNRATQYALDEMATAKLNGELQKRVEDLERKLQIKTRHCEFYEQSRKGHRSLAIHRKKQINSALEQIEKLYAKAESDYEKERNPYYDGMLSALDLAEQAIRGELEEQALKGEG